MFAFCYTAIRKSSIATCVTSHNKEMNVAESAGERPATISVQKCSSRILSRLSRRSAILQTIQHVKKEAVGVVATAKVGVRTQAKRSFRPHCDSVCRRRPARSVPNLCPSQHRRHGTHCATTALRPDIVGAHKAVPRRKAGAPAYDRRTLVPTPRFAPPLPRYSSL
jgi:hypothetical protein